MPNNLNIGCLFTTFYNQSLLAGFLRNFDPYIVDKRLKK